MEQQNTMVLKILKKKLMFLKKFTFFSVLYIQFAFGMIKDHRKCIKLYKMIF